MFKFTLFIITIFVLLFSVFAQQLPSPTPTPSPSPTNATNQTSCSGSAEIIVDLYKVVGQGEISGETMDGLETENPNLKGFEQCTYPTGFTCPQPPCEVILSMFPQSVAVTEGYNPSTDTVVKECTKNGRIKVYEFFAPNLDSLMEKAMKQLSDKIKQAIADCACPPGSAMVVTVTITGAYPITGLFGRQVGIAIDYTITVTCITPPSSDDPVKEELYTQILYRKECVKKDG